MNHRTHKLLFATFLGLAPLSYTPQTQPLVLETIVGVGTASVFTLIGVLGWKKIAENSKLEQFRRDKQSITNVQNLDVHAEFNAIAHLTHSHDLPTDIAHQLAYSETSVDTCWDKFKNFKNKFETAENQLRLNQKLWGAHSKLSQQAQRALSSNHFKQNKALLYTLYNATSNQTTRNYMHLVQVHHKVSNCNYHAIQGAYPLVEQFNLMQIHYRQLDAALKRHPGVTQLHDDAQNVLNWLQIQKNQLETSAAYQVQRKAHIKEKQKEKRLSIERRKALAEERKAQAQEDAIRLQRHNYESTIQVLTHEKRNLVDKLNQKNETIAALRLQLRALEIQKTALMQQIEQLKETIKKDQEKIAVLKQKEQELIALQHNIAQLKKSLQEQPPFNPNNEIVHYFMGQINGL